MSHIIDIISSYLHMATVIMFNSGTNHSTKTLKTLNQIDSLASTQSHKACICMNLHILQYVEYVNLIYIMNIIKSIILFPSNIECCHMKTGGFSCGKREFITRSNTQRETKRSFP